MKIRDRIKELRRVEASQLHPNPRNWRKHPQLQQDALRGVLAEIGYADALLVRERDDGGLELIDGHLRAETTPDQLVPVLVLDVSADEAAKILATHDPLAAMAEVDVGKLDELLRDIHFESGAVADMLLGVGDKANASNDRNDAEPSPADDVLKPSYQVVVECGSEQAQRELYLRMTNEGHKCRVLTL
ncbi:MAG: hypothetical protein RIC55_21325 [Pirellulaceae bacterium]